MARTRASRRYFKVGRKHYTLRKMHGRGGTKAFQRLDKNQQAKWAKWDSWRSRKQYKKQGIYTGL